MRSRFTEIPESTTRDVNPSPWVSRVWRTARRKVMALLRSQADGGRRFRSAHDDRIAQLADIRLAIRLGFFDDARRSIARMGSAHQHDADCLNLLGVIDEAGHAWQSARRWYGQAIRIDRSHAAAQQNMRRIYELATFGWSREPVALGDERPALFQLLRERESAGAGVPS